MLIDKPTILLIPGMATINTMFPGYIDVIIAGVDRAIKTYVQRDLEQKDYVEFYSGDNTPNLVLKQRPVRVVTEIRVDQTGYGGQGASNFPDSTILTAGVHYWLVVDKDGTSSHRGIVERLGGTASTPGSIAAGSWWGNPQFNTPGKLSAYKAASWPYGKGNIKATYSAGYDKPPSDILMMAGQFVAYMVRNMPTGSPLSGESFEAYSYNLVASAAQGLIPELGGLAQRTLTHYREIAI